MAEQTSPKFSVITVTYNAEKVLEPTMQSVIRQTYRNIEYILIDGNSKDGTMAVITNHLDRISHVTCEPDRGLYDAMNKGIRAATGEYLCFLNAGDTFHADDTLQQIVDSLPGGELPDVVYGETAIVDSGRQFLRMRRLRAPEHLDWKSFRHGMLVCHQAFFARRTIAEPYDPGYRFSADFDWCIRVMKKARRLHNTRLTVVDYLEEGMTTQNHKASLKERYRIMQKHYGAAGTLLFHLWFAIRAVLKK